MRKANQISEEIKKDLPSLPLEPAQGRMLQDYMNLLLKWNTKINLTSLQDPDQVYIKHILDSLVPLCEETFSRLQPALGGRILDMGSGAGLPGLLLAVMRPDWQVTSVDKVEKKVIFQGQAKSLLGLTNFFPQAGRLDELAQKEGWGQSFDLVVARAFDQLQGIFSLAPLFLKPGKSLLLWKGESWQEEWQALSPEVQGLFALQQEITYRLPRYGMGGRLLWFRHQC